MKYLYLLFGFVSMALLSCDSSKPSSHEAPFFISGIYPHLAYYNQEGECGTGAVVPWAGSLWFITYGPHLPYGSSDKLYEISENLEMAVRPESVGGTPANRMIHKESNRRYLEAWEANWRGRSMEKYQRTGGYSFRPLFDWVF